MNRIILIFTGFILFASCEKIFFKTDEASTDPYLNFDYLWNEVDKKYAYFELKNVNWDLIQVNYSTKIYDGVSEDSLFKVMGSMLNELRDDHTNLISPFNTSTYNVELKGKDNYESRTVREYYLNTDQYITGGFVHSFISNKEVGYIRYSSFMNDISDNDLDFIIKRYKETKGLIIDVRENGGGSMLNIPMILSRFVDEKTLVMYNRTRNGKEHNDFGPYEPFYITASENVRYTNKPVVILIDRGSYSATTFFSLATKALPNLTLIGDTTGGGGGLPNGGQLPNGWTYRFSITQSYDINKINYAEDGVPPDIIAEFDWSDMTKDEIIDRATQFINTGN